MKIQNVLVQFILAVILVVLLQPLHADQDRKYDGPYSGEYLDRIAFPMGGMGAGMMCLEGTGAISHVSLKHEMDFFHAPASFAALCIKGEKNVAKLLEGPVPQWKVFGRPRSARGAERTTFGLPRFEEATFKARFPFGIISLKDKEMPVDVELTGWSPFFPNDADASSLPMAALEYKFKNISNKPVEAVFSYNTPNFMKSQNTGAHPSDAILPMQKGVILWQDAVQKRPTDDFFQNSKFSNSNASGLKAEYFSNMEFKGKPKFTQTEEFVNHVFEGTVAPDFVATEFSVRWSGEIQVPQSGDYKFVVSGDDGYRLFVDEKLVFEKWMEQGETSSQTVLKLEKDSVHKIKLEYYQNQGGAVIRFGYGPFSADEMVENAVALALFVDENDVTIDHAWFKGGWWDPMTLTWNNIQNGVLVDNPPQSGPSSGASLFVPFQLGPNEEKTIRVKMAWYVAGSDVRYGEPNKEACEGEACCPTSPTYKPWYTGRFKDINETSLYWRLNYDDLRQKTKLFSDTFYDTSLPPEVTEAIAANLTILKSPTVLRQADGKMWAWEGCNDNSGCCAGSCTHVWNYAQAVPHLFPELERSLRQTEYFTSQNKEGHQKFRSNLPISPPFHTYHAAADGQLGGIMKVYREWRISGDDAWVKKFWPNVKQSLDYCIKTWDPRHVGVLEEPHHNTYDIEYWGPDGHCSSFYLGALAAAVEMGAFCGVNVSQYSDLLEKGKKYLETKLFNGEYFYQQVKTTGLNATFNGLNTKASGPGYSGVANLINQQGPKYQYGTGCLSDGVLGFWIARMSGLENEIVDQSQIVGHLKSVYKYNLKHDLFDHSNTQRPSYAVGHDGGLLLCTWPLGNKPVLPFVYSDEVWTGIEYQVASHLILEGLVDEGLDIVRVCRDRYDGRVRNPFDEYECGHWYARAMASYGLLQALTGVRYDAVDKTLYINSQVGKDFHSFLSTAFGFATVGLDNGKPFIQTKNGDIWIKRCVVSGKEKKLEFR
jgi:uncharacterized protein (DUF608 family)